MAAVKKGAGTKKSAADLDAILAVDDAAAWDVWLAKHHASSRGVWLTIAKKDKGLSSPTYAEALEAALVWGWIDGQKGSLDERAWLQRFSPRGPKSMWSKINRDKAQALIERGAMKPPGLLQVTRAKEDGRWDAAYASSRTIDVPDDLEKAFEANPKAKAFFTTLDSANRYAVLFRVHTAKKVETRAARIEKLVAMLGRKEKIHP